MSMITPSRADEDWHTMNPVPPTPVTALRKVADALFALASALHRLHDAFSSPETVATWRRGLIPCPTAAAAPNSQKREKVSRSQQGGWQPERLERAVEVIMMTLGTSMLGEEAILSAPAAIDIEPGPAG
jgi:hypothetical protein